MRATPDSIFRAQNASTPLIASTPFEKTQIDKQGRIHRSRILRSRALLNSITLGFAFALCIQRADAVEIQSLEQLPPFASGPVELGIGYNALEQRDAQNMAIDKFKTVEGPGANEGSGMVVIETRESFRKLTSYSAKVSAKFGAGGGNTRVRKVEESEYNSTSVYLVGVSFKVTQSQKAVGGVLVPGITERLEEGKFGDLLNRYGTTVINQVDKGGMCIIVFEIQCRDSKEKKSVAAAISAHYKGVSGNANRSVMETRLRGKRTQQMQVAVIGRSTSVSTFPTLDLDAIKEFVQNYNTTIDAPVSWTFDTRAFSAFDNAPRSAVTRRFEEWTEQAKRLKKAISDHTTWTEANYEMVKNNSWLFQTSREQLESANAKNELKIASLIKHYNALVDGDDKTVYVETPGWLATSPLPPINRRFQIPLSFRFRAAMSHAGTRHGLFARFRGGMASFEPPPSTAPGPDSPLFGKMTVREPIGFYYHDEPKIAPQLAVPELRSIWIDIEANIDALRLEYSVLHKGSTNWTGWFQNGEFTVPEAPIIAFRAKLAGTVADHYKLQYALWDCRGTHGTDRASMVDAWTPRDGEGSGYAGSLNRNRRGFTAFSFDVVAR